MENIQRELTQELIKASEEYYNNGQSFLSDIEFDKKLEEEYQVVKVKKTVQTEKNCGTEVNLIYELA